MFSSGRGTYGAETEEVGEELDKHLFQCRTENGLFVGEQVLGFRQNSLIPEAVWLLDAGSVIWVWIGKFSVPKTLQECVEDATIYLYTHPAGRNRNTTISVIKQGLEPATFIGLFENWNHNLLRDYKPFEVFCGLIEDRDQSTRTPMAKATTDFDNYIKYPPATLKSEPENLPTGVDVRRKEMHLTYDNFIAIFKMEPAEFEKLPAWKRQRLKQTAGLF